MKDETNSSGFPLIGFFVALLQVVFITLKLTGKLDWSWWWVWSPTIAYSGVIVGFVFLFGILMILALGFSE